MLFSCYQPPTYSPSLQGINHFTSKFHWVLATSSPNVEYMFGAGLGFNESGLLAPYKLQQ